MGFLDHFRNRPDQDIQGNLFAPADNAQIIFDRQDPTQLAVYRRLHDLIKARGGRDATHRAINAIAIREMLDEDPNTLYEALGIPQGDRSRLPTEAKEALMVGNIAAFYEILHSEDAQGHSGIIRAGDRGYQRVSGIYSWQRQRRTR